VVFPFILIYLFLASFDVIAIFRDSGACYNSTGNNIEKPVIDASVDQCHGVRYSKHASTLMAVILNSCRKIVS